jgi:hypothetical protein
VVTGNKADLKKLVTLMSQDLDSAIVAQNPKLAESIAKANQFYSEGINKLNSHYGKKIFGLRKQPDKILTAIINKSASIEDIPLIYSIIGPDNIPAVQAAFLEHLFNSARSVETKTFTPAGLLRQIDSFGIDKLKAILTDAQLKAVTNIAEVARGLGKAEKIMGGSQTAFLAKTFGSLGLLFTNPLLGIKILGGDALLSKFVSSKAGQNLLTQGINFEQAGKKVAEALKTNAKGIGQKANLLRTGGIIKNESD